jgi:hypothetical protein
MAWHPHVYKYARSCAYLIAILIADGNIPAGRTAGLIQS